VTYGQIEGIVLGALRGANRGRALDQQLLVAPDAPLFAPGSPLDSLGLVSLLIDIEEALEDAGCPVALSDARAMSQSQSPFRSVSSLIRHIEASLGGAR